MPKMVAVVALAIVLAQAYRLQNGQWTKAPPSDPEMQRQEILVLEREMAHAIQLHDRTFFNRVYADDFTGTLSHGQPVDKTQLATIVQTPAIPYETFVAGDIKVRLYEDTAVATCLWAWRANIKGQEASSAMRVVHVYVNTGSGWKVVSSQNTQLPPLVQQPL